MTALYQASVPSALHALERAQHLVTLTPPELLHARLQEDMFDFTGQIRTTGFMSLRATFLLAGKAVPQLLPVESGKLNEWLGGIATQIESLNPDEFDETLIISHRAGFADLEQPAWEYLTQFALSNLWFHLSMVYAILRVNGVDVGKGDYDGLHEYPKGFSF